ncbi:unnamed protein product [Leuciscus chuanchicus]
MNLFIFVPVWVFRLGASGVYTDRESVFVMEGDSVSLNTDVKTDQQEKIKWYFNNIRIAQINGDLSKICTDVQCNEGTERFRDRLKLDHQIGSLSLSNITNTDSGLYKLQIIGSNTISETIFSMTVHDVPGAETDKTNTKSVKEGESFTFDPGVIKNPNDGMTWYFNEARIAEITGNQSKICTDVQCKERFKDRLKLDHQTGSLTITNTRNTDSGVYHLEIFSNSSIIHRQRSISIIRENSFNVPVTGLIVAIPGVAVGVLLVLACVIGKRYRKREVALGGGYSAGTGAGVENLSLIYPHIIVPGLYHYQGNVRCRRSRQQLQSTENQQQQQRSTLSETLRLEELKERKRETVINVQKILTAVTINRKPPAAAEINSIRDTETEGE